MDHFWVVIFTPLTYARTPHSLDCYRFGVSFEIGKYESSNFFSPQGHLALLDLFNFHTNSRFTLSISAKKEKSAEILIQIALNLLINLGSIVIVTIFRLAVYEDGVSLFNFPLISLIFCSFQCTSLRIFS